MKRKICALALAFAMLISLSSVSALAAAVPFKDTAGHWAEEAISSVVEKKLFQGTSGDTFSPNAGMDRGMFVTVLGRFAQGMGYTVSGTSAFTDVQENDYFAPYVAWASANGIVQGVGGGEFAPKAPVTREQMCALFLRFLGYVGYTVPQGEELAFADNSKISGYAVEPVKTAVTLGLIQGARTSEGMVFRPSASATRAEVATVFLRLDGLEGIHDLKPADPVKPDTPSNPDNPSGGGGGGTVTPVTPVTPAPTAEEKDKEKEIAGYLTTMVRYFNDLTNDEGSYYYTADPEVRACSKMLMDCINQALKARDKGAFLSREYVRTTYKDTIAKVRSSYKSMSEEQKTQFKNIVIRLEDSTSHIRAVMDYFGVSLS